MWFSYIQTGGSVDWILRSAVGNVWKAQRVEWSAILWTITKFCCHVTCPFHPISASKSQAGMVEILHTWWSALGVSLDWRLTIDYWAPRLTAGCLNPGMLFDVDFPVKTYINPPNHFWTDSNWARTNGSVVGYADIFVICGITIYIIVLFMYLLNYHTVCSPQTMVCEVQTHYWEQQKPMKENNDTRKNPWLGSTAQQSSVTPNLVPTKSSWHQNSLLFTSLKWIFVFTFIQPESAYRMGSPWSLLSSSLPFSICID